MRNVPLRIAICAGLMLMSSGLAVAGEAGRGRHIQVAGGSDCHKRCQAQENQCRMSSKDLDSSVCAARFLACIQSCRGR